MTKKRRLMKKTAAAIGLFSLSLATLICSGVAWITTNASSSVSYDNMRLFDETEDNIIHDYRFYNCLGNATESDGIEYVYFSTEETTSPGIGLYDRELDTHNHQLLIEVRINPGYASLMPYAKAEKNPLPKGLWSDVDWDNSTSFPLSLIVAMRVYGTVAPAIENVTIGTTYSGDAFKIPYSTDNMDAFVSFNGSADNPVFTSPMNIDGDNLSSYAITQADDGYGRIYLLLDYNENAISAIYSYNIGKDIFNSEAPIPYYSDFLIAFEEVSA